MLTKNILLYFFFLFLPGKVPIQDYGPVQLDWDTHYKAKPDDKSEFYALTALVFTYSYESVVRGNQLSLKFKFTADVDRTKSWVKRIKLTNETVSAALLRHEQGHANINYLLMRETENRLKNKRYSVKNYKKEIEDLAKKIYDRYEEMQKKYDEETGHGAKDTEQKKWNDFIAQSLSELI